MARNIAPDQRGIASIIITMISMVIVSLIVLGFATLSRREQRQSLDQQLSAQAFYAAESGIEDARGVIQASLASGLSFRKDKCTTNNGAGFASYPTAISGATQLNVASKVSYTCLTVDDTPSSVDFSGVGSGNVVVPLQVDPTGPSIRQVKVEWKPSALPASGPASCPASTNNTLRPQATWNCGYGMLRADLTLTDGAFDRATLTGNTLTAFFEPLNNNPGGAGLINFNSQKGSPNLIPAQCVQAATYDGCTATITNIPNNIRSMAIKASSLYQTSNIQIQALDNAGNPIDLLGVQATIDATGKAQDVLRRIRVRLPLVNTGGTLPGAPLQSNGSICKRFLIRADYFAVDGSIIDPDLTNDMCDSSNVDS